MPHTSHRLALGILRNAGALSLVGALDKGAGLVVAILVARFLGPDAMGLFALLFSMAMLIQIAVTMGMSESLVQEVAARPRLTLGFYRSALTVVSRACLPIMIAATAAALVFLEDGAARRCILVIAIGAPFSGAFGVAQALLQGMERVRFLTCVSFVARAFSLVFLAWAFRQGAGLEFAFVSALLFHVACLIPFHATIRRLASAPERGPEPEGVVGRAVPFALNRGVRELSLRLPSLVLPAVAGLVSAGIFDAANRVRNTLGVIVSASITGLTPALARNLAASGTGPSGLVGYTVKYMCVGMSILAVVIVVLADWIIDLLFGDAFAGAKRAMQILAWAQVLNAADAVLHQAMLARHRAYRAMRYTSIATGAQLLLVIVLTGIAGLPGAATGVLLSSALALVLDLRFVTGHIVAVPALRFVWAPLAAVGAVAWILLIVDDLSLLMRAVIAVGAWASAMAVFGVLPAAELRFMARLVTPARGAGKEGP